METLIRRIRNEYHDAISELVATTTRSYVDIGREFGCSEQTVYSIARQRRIGRAWKTPVAAVTSATETDDMLVIDEQFMAQLDDLDTVAQDESRIGGHIYTKGDFEEYDQSEFIKAAGAAEGDAENAKWEPAADAAETGDTFGKFLTRFIQCPKCKQSLRSAGYCDGAKVWTCGCPDTTHELIGAVDVDADVVDAWESVCPDWVVNADAAEVSE